MLGDIARLLARAEQSVDEWDRDPVGLKALVESPYWKDLRELNIAGGTIHTLPALEMFLALPKIASLRILRLGEFSEDRREGQDEAARLLAAAPVLDGLIELSLGKSVLSEQAQRLLQDRFGDQLILTD